MSHRGVPCRSQSLAAVPGRQGWCVWIGGLYEIATRIVDAAALLIKVVDTFSGCCLSCKGIRPAWSSHGCGGRNWHIWTRRHHSHCRRPSPARIASNNPSLKSVLSSAKCETNADHTYEVQMQRHHRPRLLQVAGMRNCQSRYQCRRYHRKSACPDSLLARWAARHLVCPRK